jgi:predicted GNAT family acetyltransferase
MEIKDNQFLRQFETTVDNQLLRLEYQHQERKIFLTKITIPESITDDTIVNDFIKNVLDLLKEKELKVVPTASKVASFFRKNPIYKSLLPPGIVI